MATETLAPLSTDEMVAEIVHAYQVESPCLGPSKIIQYLRCPMSYKLQYVDKLPSKSSPAASVGSTVHKVIETAHRSGWSAENMDEAAALLEELWGAVRPHTSDPDDPQAGKSINEARDVWLPWYLSWQDGQRTIASEERWRIDLETNGMVIPMQGTIDRVYRADGSVIVSDVKTGQRKPSQADLSNDLQLSLYSWAFREMSGQAETWMEIVWMRSQETLRTVRTAAYLRHVVDDVVIPAAKAINAGVYPCNPHTKYGCNYCDHKSACPVGQGA